MTATTSLFSAPDGALRAHRLQCIAALTAGVAHGLNNHLAALVMLLDVLEPGLATEQAPLATALRESVKGSIQAIRQLESLAKRGEDEPLLYQPLYVVKGIVSLLREGFAPEVAGIVDDLTETCLVEGNPALLHQLVLAFSLAALAALPAGGELVLRTVSDDEGGEGGEGGPAGLHLRVDVLCSPARPPAPPEGEGTGAPPPPAELLAALAAEGGWISEHPGGDRRGVSIHLPAAPTRASRTKPSPP
jgi:signal transduction histidine kinase